MPTAPQPLRRDAPMRAIAFMLTGAVSFATMNALARAMRHLPWPMLGFSRALLGLLFALALARARGASLAIVDRRRMWQRSLAGTTGMLCTFYALTHMPLADATALLNTTPLWIAALAWVALRETISPRVLTALVVASAGVVLVERPGLRGGGFAGLVALGAGCAGALAMINLRRLSGETPEAVVVHFSATAAAILGALSLRWFVAHGAPPSVGWQDLAGVLAMGATATLGQLAITRAYALDKAAGVGAAGWIQVVIALAIDAVVFGRRPEGTVLAGIALLLGSGALLVDDARRAQRAMLV
ncbi:MAG: DMT family transporter [Deltaproteobacteria bacterium]|nr:DMT family transporter [Deltaproteobacteria bacterium]